MAGYNSWSFFRQPNLVPQSDDRPERLACGRRGADGFIAGSGRWRRDYRRAHATDCPCGSRAERLPIRPPRSCRPAVALYKNATLPSHGISIWASIQLAAMIVPTAMFGAYLGGRLTHVLPRKLLLIIFIVFMATIAVLTFQTAWTTVQGRVRVCLVRYGAGNDRGESRIVVKASQQSLPYCSTAARRPSAWTLATACAPGRCSPRCWQWWRWQRWPHSGHGPGITRDELYHVATGKRLVMAWRHQGRFLHAGPDAQNFA